MTTLQYSESPTPEGESLPQLLDSIYLPDDISTSPTMQEYRKLKRIMKVMVRFYTTGTERKYEQVQEVDHELHKLETDRKMLLEQLEALKPFPESHPKVKAYLVDLNTELEAMERTKAELTNRREELFKLHEWSKGIVQAVTWLEQSIEDYCNSELNIQPEERFKSAFPELTIEQRRAYKRGLDEVTFNLQESMDFFEASLDGRLIKFHEQHKQMIEAQLAVLRRYPEDNPRRRYLESELQKDLEYAEEHMHDTPQSLKHKQRMRDLHRDFFRVLRWQRERLKGIVEEDETKLPKERKEIEILKDAESRKMAALDAGCPVASSSSSSSACPVSSSTASTGCCPFSGKVVPTSRQ